MTEGGLRPRAAGYCACVLRSAFLFHALPALLVVTAFGGAGSACSLDGEGIRGPEPSLSAEGGLFGTDGQAPTNEGGMTVLPGAEGGSLDGALTDGTSSSSEAAADAAPPRGPTPPLAGVNFPFPQNRQSSHCSYPTRYLNSDVQAAYMQWYTDTVTSSGAGGFLRVQRLPSDSTNGGMLPTGSTVSEGIGYGMLIAVYMNDQTLFDGLWQYEQLPANLDVNGLMNWSIGPDGTMNPDGSGGATDADEDMAFALAMADKQWGGQGSLPKTYHAYAVQQIQAVWANEIFDYMYIIPGDMWGPPKSGANINVSYFAPAYYRVFAALDPMAGSPGMDDWSAAIDSSYSVLNLSLNAANGNQSNGLVPAWCSSTGGAPGPGQPTNYQYDSCRTPFRIGLDWCWNAEPRAQTYVGLTSGFFSGIGAANIADGYALNGTPEAAHPGMLSAAFIGPAGVGAMSSTAYQPFIDNAYSEVATLKLLAGGTYYEDSWTILSMLMMSANFLDYTAY
jgi:endo-1,4-beta-D-glucanase Y